MEEPQLPFVALGFDARMQVIAPTVVFAVGNAGSDSVAYRTDYGGDRRTEFTQVLARPGTHSDDQVDVRFLLQSGGDRCAHGGAPFRIEVTQIGRAWCRERVM